MAKIFVDIKILRFRWGWLTIWKKFDHCYVNILTTILRVTVRSVSLIFDLGVRIDSGSRFDRESHIKGSYFLEDCSYNTNDFSIIFWYNKRVGNISSVDESPYPHISLWLCVRVANTRLPLLTLNQPGGTFARVVSRGRVGVGGGG